LAYEGARMKAMILAAGLGTRLRPLTDDRPKALVDVAGKTLLEITLTRLRSFGVRDVIINVHHFADMIVGYLKFNENFGMHIEISREDDLLLDTGGGLKKAAWFFLENGAADDDPFILHNVDVLSNIDLRRMLAFHLEKRALATLMVQERKTSRYLLFDEEFLLCGRRSALLRPQQGTTGRAGAPREDWPYELARSAANLKALAFSGIHIISPRLLPMMTEQGAFSIIATYLRLAAEGERIVAFRADDAYWRDLGNLDSLQQAAEDVVRAPDLLS
jgi:NDP-sugar pyrophosphorylase family protein